ncbi:EF-hand domain-containing protein [archaeon]|nr:MAG: EF-hand domain-containing protein [archaeon]
MNAEIASATNTVVQPKTRKQVTKKLSTGQKISLSLQDERTLRSIYEYLAGYATRRNIESIMEVKKSDVSKQHAALPPSARLLLQMQPKSALLMSYQTQNNHSTDGGEADSTNKSEVDQQLDEYFKTKEQLHKLEEKLKAFSSTDHKISFKDLDAILKSLGATFHRKQIEQLIWEVDENLDGLIDYDELQLTYYRNITDSTGSEPCFFFKILEVYMCNSCIS